MMKVLKKILLSKKKNQPFVVYKKPNKKNIIGFFQKNNKEYYTHKYIERGFIFAPFDNAEKTILIPENKSKKIKEKIFIKDINIIKNTDFFLKNIEKENQYKKNIKKAIESIIKKEFKKVVLSRKEEVNLVDFDLIQTFKRLVCNYPYAMVYMWFHPKTGIWLGATPETLLKIKNNHFKTMSLAATRKFNGNINVKWNEKEIDEQKIVTDYIIKNLKLLSKNIFSSKLKTIKAGNLLHIQTIIKGKSNSSIKTLINYIHPTPAVCGFPKEKSKQFILKNENYKRSFYTGYLGELNIKDKKLNSSSNLYVNLRCMQIHANKAFIYVGGGITKNSLPEKEWNETIEKTLTMKKVL